MPQYAYCFDVGAIVDVSMFFFFAWGADVCVGGE